MKFIAMFCQPAVDAVIARKGLTDQLLDVIDELLRTVTLYNGHQLSNTESLPDSMVYLREMVSSLVPQWGTPVHIVSYDDEIVCHLPMEGRIQPMVIFKAVQ